MSLVSSETSSYTANLNPLGRVIGAGIGATVAFGVVYSFGMITLGDADISLKLGAIYSVALLARNYITDPGLEQLLRCNKYTPLRNLTANVAGKITAHAIAVLAIYPILPSVMADPSPLAYSLMLTFGIPLAAAAVNKGVELIHKL